MPVFGLVLILRDDAPSRIDEVTALLATQPGLELGPPEGARLPAVLECDGDRKSSDAALRALEEIDGIEQLEIVYTDFEDLVGRDGPDTRPIHGESRWT